MTETPANFSVWLNEAMKRFAGYPHSYSFCHYKIVSNEVSYSAARTVPARLTRIFRSIASVSANTLAFPCSSTIF